MTDRISVEIKSLEEELAGLQNIECFVDGKHYKNVQKEIELIEAQIDSLYDDAEKGIGFGIPEDYR